MSATASSEPRLHFVQCLGAAGLHRMAYWAWGPSHEADGSTRPVLVCAHGLSRQGRDFDTLARALVDRYHVVCPDVAGRGRSDWLAEPGGYAVPAYVADMVTLLARLEVEQVDWVGTSMGGLIGLVLASLPRRSGPSLVRRLVLNDVGPAIQPAAIERIAAYVGQPARYASVDEAAGRPAEISQGFGPQPRERWLALTRPMLREVHDAQGNGWVLHYDPAIAVPIRAMTPAIAAAGEAALWQAWDRIAAPTLLLRGAESDLLSRETAAAMSVRGPRAQVHEVPGVGHAPMLVEAEQIAVVRGFLLAGTDAAATGAATPS